MITNISIDKLVPHPNNPRKDLGDLTELSESIKANGVFQNLTVVPNNDDTYTVIIGHRRMAASKLAGLTELPCAVVEMSEKEQLGTMLLENMQRSDLTVYEQAQGFQMMLDLGESVESISDKTGFGKSTIYKRVKLCQLDKDLFKKAQERGATLEDYAKLDKITDLELKNKALECIGTANFDNAVQTAVADEKYNAKLEKWETILSSFATRLPDFDRSKHEYVRSVHMYATEYDKFEVPSDANEVDYFYRIGTSKWDRERIEIYKERTKNSLQEAYEDEERKRKEEDRQLRKKSLNELSLAFSKARADVNAVILTVMCVYVQITNTDNYRSVTTPEEIKLLFELLDIEYKKEYNNYEDLHELMQYTPEIETVFNNNPVKFMLAALYVDTELEYYSYSVPQIKTWDYYAQYNEQFSEYYNDIKYLNTLKALGYQMSDEESSLYDGTHELYYREQEESVDVADMPQD